ncbi:hypothetical protein M231_04964 [Tremella mesenterica]|uniref:Uncharacterized protein n=1 Tax=Tremella mesenterica TaxID=5217 RepID=A0A4Q1BJ97_TREME|nr:hypothetical protein M231_04964 [Tremella mesenterica]
MDDTLTGEYVPEGAGTANPIIVRTVWIITHFSPSVRRSGALTCGHNRYLTQLSHLIETFQASISLSLPSPLPTYDKFLDVARPIARELANSISDTSFHFCFVADRDGSECKKWHAYLHNFRLEERPEVDPATLELARKVGEEFCVDASEGNGATHSPKISDVADSGDTETSTGDHGAERSPTKSS